MIDIASKFYSKLTAALKQASVGKKPKGNFGFNTVNDLADLIKYSELVMSGQFKKAQIMQSEFDTFVYELIPNFLFGRIEYMDEKLL